MSCILPALEQVAARVSGQLAPYLRGPFGGLLRTYLPQTWLLEVGPEVYCLEVDRDGRCTARPGSAGSPDVVITVEHDRLRAALTGQAAEGGRRTAYAVRCPTSRGELAFRFLRQRFGLSEEGRSA